MKSFGRVLIKISVTFLALFFCVQSTFAQVSLDAFDANLISLTDEEKVWIKDHPVLKVAHKSDFAPIEFIQNGEPTGFATDYFNLVASKAGLKIDYISGYNWSELQEKIKRREIDLSHNLIITEDRLKYLKFTRPYFEMPYVYYGREGSDKINSAEDLYGKRIGVVTGSGIIYAFENEFQGLEIVEQATIKDGLLALSLGNIDVFVNILHIANYIIGRDFIAGLEIVGNNFPDKQKTAPIRIGVRSDWPILVEILEKSMRLVSEQEFLVLSEKWLSRYNPASTIELTGEEISWLNENSTVFVVTDPFAPPNEFINAKGEIDGMSGDYLDIIAKKLNIEFIWASNRTWADGLALLKAGKADIITGANVTEERLEYLTFTEPYISAVSAIFARDGADFNSLEELVGRRVAQVEGYGVNDYIRENYPDIEIVITDNVANALQLVSIGDVDAFVSGIQTAAYPIANRGIANIIVVGATTFNGDLRIGVRQELPLLKSAIQKALASITIEEKMAISQKWLSLKIENEIDYTRIWQISIAALFLFLCVLLWVNHQRKEIERRKEVEKKLLLLQEEAQKARHEAELANAVKSNFLANMSHEIRTPLNAIIGFSEMMSTDTTGKIQDEKYREYVLDIKDSGNHLATVINDILDLSKIEADKWTLNKTKFSIDACVLKTMNMIKTDAEKKNIYLSYDNENHQDMTLMADESALKRIILNLLSNSIKYTKNDGKVICKVSKSNDNNIVIQINDNGIGIPEDRLEKVLNPFEQIQEGYNLKEEGTGLGLPIVKQLTILHGGEFILKSKIGVGTTATIILPLTE